MAVSNEDLARLVVSLEATTTRYYNALRKAQQQTNTSATAIEKRLTGMSSNIDRTFANLGKRLSANLTGPLAGIGAAFSIREVLEYADAWTTAGNQIAAASDITGIQSRSLEELRKVADDSRAGFEETVKLYTRIQRSAADVAESELDIARATSIVNKAFKAGGAATSEFNAGVLQLSQGLGSGVLQGDELRSVRENAPVLAKVIADYFGVTIAGLKELGSEGKLTSEEVFKAILSGEKQIESAFATTQATISDGFTRVRNALIEYVGTADQASGVTLAINAGLNALADNFSTVADVTLKLAALIAGALVGRSLVAMIGSVTAAGVAIGTLITAMRTASVAGAGFSTILAAAGVAAGPIATVIGGIAFLALQHFTSQALEASNQIRETNKLLDEMGLTGSKSGRSIQEAADNLEKLAAANDKYAESERRRRNDQTRSEIGSLTEGNSIFGAFGKASSDLQSLREIALRANEQFGHLFEPQDVRENYNRISSLVDDFRNKIISIEELGPALANIISSSGANQDIVDLAKRFYEIANDISRREIYLKINGDTKPIEDAKAALDEAVATAIHLSSIGGPTQLSEDLQALQERLKDADLTAEEAGAEFLRIAQQNINSPFGDLIGGLQTLVTNYIQATQAARDFNAATVIAPSGPFESDRRLADLSKNVERDNATKKYIEDQRTYNALSLEERNIQEEIAKIVKDAKKDGTDLDAQDARVRQLAIDNLALKESDRASTKSGRDSARDIQKYNEDLAQQEKSLELLQKELEFRSQLNPLINDYGYALAAYRKEQELINEAEAAGIAITPELRERYKALAEGLAEVDAQTQKLEESQQKLRDSVQEWADFAKSATRSLIDDLIEGKSAAEAFGNVLADLGSKLIDLGLNTIFGGGAGGGFGLIGQLFGIPGRASGGPVSKGQPYVVGEKRPELFVPTQNGVIIPRIPNAMGTSSGINTPIQISIDATGADRDGLMRVQQEIVNLRSQVPSLIRQQVSKRTQKGW